MNIARLTYPSEHQSKLPNYKKKKTKERILIIRYLLSQVF